MKTLKQLLCAAALTCSFAMVAFSQAPNESLLWVRVDDLGGAPITVYYGNANNATYYIDDGTGGTTNYFESIAPPSPPDPAFDVRWKGISGRNNTPIVDGLFPRDFRAIPVNAALKDTFLLVFKSSGLAGSASIFFYWNDNASLLAHCDSAFFVYNNGSGNITIDMRAQSSVEIMSVGDNAITQAKIYKYGCKIIDGVKDKPAVHPVEFSLKPNYPNPFNPSTNIAYDIAKNSTVDVSIFNVLGQKIATLVTGQMIAGEHITLWNGTTQNGSPVSSGVYFVRMNARVDGTGEVFTALHKLLLMK